MSTEEFIQILNAMRAVIHWKVGTFRNVEGGVVVYDNEVEFWDNPSTELEKATVLGWAEREDSRWSGSIVYKLTHEGLAVLGVER